MHQEQFMMICNFIMYMNFLDKHGTLNLLIHGFVFFKLFFAKLKILVSMVQHQFTIMLIEQVFQMLEQMPEHPLNNLCIFHNK